MSSEVTVEVLCTKEELFDIFRVNGFFFKDTLMMTDYYYTHLRPEQCTDYNMLLTNSFLIRDVRVDKKYFSSKNGSTELLYKKKTFDKYGKVDQEQKISTEVFDVDKANKVFRSAGLHNWCIKKFIGHPFKRGNIHILVQEVVGLGLFLEIEDFEGQTGTKEEILDELVDILNELRIPMGNDYHISIAKLLLLKNLGKAGATVPVNFSPVVV
jgi:predicted adenylyl cyclase CyaB